MPSPKREGSGLLPGAGRGARGAPARSHEAVRIRLLGGFSDKLGGKLAADYLNRCQNGSVFGRAEIEGEDATSTFSTTGVKSNSDFICNAPSENVLVRRDFTGHYKVVFGDVEHSGKIGDLFSGPGPEPKPMVSSRENDKIVSATGPFQCAASPPPTVTCYIVEVRDFAGPLVDGNFTIAVL
jgi:hypothetical protein